MKRAALVPILVSLLVVLLIQAPGASAHTELILSDPAEGAVLGVDPPEVLLAFSEELIPDTVSVSVADGTGFVVTVAAPDVDGADVSFPWPPALTGPDYTVNYRVVSQDGHPVSGSLSFTGGVPAPASASAVPSLAVAAPSAAPSDSTGSPSESADTSASPAADGSGIPSGAIIAVAVGLAIGIAVGFVLIGRRRRVGAP